MHRLKYDGWRASFPIYNCRGLLNSPILGILLIRYRPSSIYAKRQVFFWSYFVFFLLFEIGFHVSWAGLDPGLPTYWKMILNFWLLVLNTTTLSSYGAGGWTLGFSLLDKHSTNWAPSSAPTFYMGRREEGREGKGKDVWVWMWELKLGETEAVTNAPWRVGAWEKGTPTHIHWTLFFDFFLMRWMPSSTLVMS